MITVACVKWGDKYSSDYVNRLEKMVAKNLTVKHKFVCITDDITNLECDTILPTNEFELEGWWAKMFLYRPGMLSGRVLYLDLDVVIQNNIDELVGYTDSLCGIYTKWNEVETGDDYHYGTLRNKRPFNSSVLTFNAEDYHWVWDHFVSDPNNNIMKYYGDDKYLAAMIPDIKTFPDEWIYSRLYGIDEYTPCNDKVNLTKFTVQECHYYPERLICILNGPTSEAHYGGNLAKYYKYA